MGAAENKQFISNMFIELSKGNAEAFLGSIADDVRYTIIGTTKYSGTFNGKQELIKQAAGPADRAARRRYRGDTGQPDRRRRLRSDASPR